MKKFTPYLFFISLILSIVSIFTTKFLNQEVYPFYSWRLFTKPSGAKEIHSVYWLYGVKNNDTLRIPNKKTNLLDENEKFTIINSAAENITENIEKEKSIKKLKIYVSKYARGYEKYFLVRETFKPKNLDSTQNLLKKEIIIEL